VSGRKGGEVTGAGSTRSFYARSPGRRRERSLVYVCGPTAFVEVAASGLVELGHDAERIKTERFGPTGG
jgi:ferredoxin-NADP reductase